MLFFIIDCVLFPVVVSGGLCGSYSCGNICGSKSQLKSEETERSPAKGSPFKLPGTLQSYGLHSEMESFSCNFLTIHWGEKL